jgi:predicted transcriptional regulator
MNRYGSDQEHRRVLKIIDTSNKEHIPVTDNVYGYTAVFSNRPVKL